MTKSVGERNFDFKIIYSKRRSIGISVGPESGVIVRAPNRTSEKTIENLIIAKTHWINKHLENFRTSVRIKNVRDITDGSSTFLFGKEYFVRIIESGKSSVNINGNIIEIGLKNNCKDEIAGLLLEKWYRKYAEGLFRKKFGEVLLKFESFSFNPSELSVKALKRRWGSCSSKGKITLSSELVKLDEIYLEYVILHELCHLRHHNHGKEFYELLREVFPDWKQRRSELKKFIR